MAIDPLHIIQDNGKSDNSFSSQNNNPPFNAFLLIPGKGANEALWALKHPLFLAKCRYSKLPFRGWICPKDAKETVESLFRRENVEISFKEIFDEYFEKPKNFQKADALWSKIDLYEERFEAERRSILIPLNSSPLPSPPIPFLLLLSIKL